MTKVKDFFTIFVCFCIFLALAVQSIAFADTPGAETALRLRVNPCKIIISGGPVYEVVPASRRDTELIATPTLSCSRALNSSHNRVYWVSQIEKYHSRSKNVMSYRPYAKALPWTKGQPFSHMAPAAIRCDVTGKYRVKVRYWTADANPMASSYPSLIAKYTSPWQQLCENTPRRPLSEVNNPVIVRLR